MSVRWRSRVFTRPGSGRGRNLRRGIAAAGAAVLLFTMTDQVVLPPAAAAPACPASRADELSATLAARACGGRVEVLSQRNETTQVWARPGGGFSTEIYAGPVRFRQGAAWKDVDLTLRPTGDGAIEPVGHPRGLRLAGAATGTGERVLARVETAGDSIAMLWDGPLPAPVLAADTATYREVRPGVDLLLTATRLGFEQSLVVKNRAAAARVATMTVPLRSENLRFVADSPASFAIRDAAGRTVGRVPTPMAWDSSVGASGERVRETALTVRIGASAPRKGADVSRGTGDVDLRLAADTAWLQDPKTRYPVTLDPQIELDPAGDTLVRSDELSTSGKADHSGADYLAYGKATSYLARSFMQWPSARFAGARITNATLSLWNWYSGSCAQTGWLAWDTAPFTNPIWWDTAPALLTNDGYSTQTAGFSAACNDAWVSAGVTPMFQRAADTGKPTVYMGLTSYNETNPSLSWKQVRSLQAPVNSEIPVVRVDYEYPEQGGLFRYGQNYPYGQAAVDYIYSPDKGMWKDLNGLKYQANRYGVRYPEEDPKKCDGPFYLPEPKESTHEGHECDRNLLIDQVKDKSWRQTALDINEHLLFDYDNNLVVDPAAGGYAFHEHFARGQGGAEFGDPYMNFWFDDNWLARHMAQAYSRPQPNGLSDNGSHIRWKILSGDRTWKPYDQLPIPEKDKNLLDRLAMDGLYYLSAGSQQTALDKWDAFRARTGFTFNSSTRMYEYPRLEHWVKDVDPAENYHAGLAKLLIDQILIHHTGLTPVHRGDLNLHSVSLRALIIKNQQREGGTRQLLGWTTDADLNHNPRSLMNTETIAVNSLALAAGAKSVYSAGQAPLQTPAAGNYARTSTGLLQAVPGTSSPGHMSFGPNQTFAPGSYNAEFVMRSHNPVAGTQVANIEVYDARTGTSIVPPTVLTAGSFAVNGTYDRFIRFTLPFTVSSANNSLEFRVWWYGGANPLDIAEIRLR